MTFEEILDQAIAMLQRRGRMTYRTLQRQFALDEDALNDLKDELLYAHPEVRDDAGRGLVWTGEASTAPPATSLSASTQDREPLSYTPPYLAEKILTSKSALEGERKQVTVLFADIKDSTELIKDLDPEAAQQLLDPALHRMMDAVHRFEGTVNQVLGDGIMALFGAPIAHEDHALRACYTALALQTAMQAYAEDVRRRHGVTLRLRVGLNAGEVVVRTIGNDLHMDYSAVGQTVHLAARMEQLAPPGSVLLTAATLRLVEGMVRVQALGPLPVKGFTEPVEGFELLGASGLRRRLQAAVARGLTRFVGRETEMAALVQACERARTGHGQVVAAVGLAGVGKSRLLYEFVHSPRTQGWLVLEAVSVSYGKATPYFPVVDLLKRYVHVEDGDEPRTVRAKVTGALLTLDETLQDTIPAVLALLDALPADSPFLTLDPPQRRQRTLDALKRILLRESQVQPLLVVFEDLHWIDAETQALLDHLVESLPTAPLLLLVNYRPEYQHGWGSKTYYTQLRLDPLPPASTADVLHALLGVDPSLGPLKELLVARTAGNPFFLEESVRTLVETGVLVGEPSAYRLAQALPTIQVPATVQAVLAARIDRLPPEAKRLLQTAAVIGHEVSVPLMQTLAELPEADLHRRLARLQAAEFLYETRLFPEREYTFAHALTHEVVYTGMLQERRRMLHARIVEILDQLAAERVAEQVDRLAHHAVRGEVWDKAVTYCRQAGTKALAASAYRAAVEYWEQALAALAHLPPDRATLEQAIDLRCELYVPLLPLAEWEQTLVYLREAETLAKGLGDPRRLAAVSRRLAVTFGNRQDYELQFTYCQRTHALAAALGDGDLQSYITFELGKLFCDLGDYRQARECLQQTIALGERLDQAFGRVAVPSVNAPYRMVGCLREQGDFAEGIALSHTARHRAEVVGRPYERLGAAANLGALYVHQGALSQAIPLLEQVVAGSQDTNIPLWYRFASAFLALAYTLAGRAADARTALGQAGDSARVPLTCAEAYLRAGCVEEAQRLTQRALAHARHRKMRGNEARALWLLGEIAMGQDPPDRVTAAAYYQQALALADDLGMRPLVAHCHLGLGTLYTTTGQQEQARAALSTAIALYRAMEMTFWLPQTEAALAQVEEQ